MTLTTQNRFLIAGIFLVTVLCAGYCLLLLYFGHRLTASWNLLQIFHSYQNHPFPWKAITGTVLFSLAASAVFLRFFRKINSSQIFFFIIFLYTLSLDGLKILHLFIGLFQLPLNYHGILTRCIYFAKLSGIFFLFSCSLSSNKGNYQSTGLIILIGIFAAVTITTFIPVDSVVLNNAFLNTLGNLTELLIAAGLVLFLAAANYFITGYNQGNREYIVLGISFILIGVGREFLFFLPEGWFMIFGFVFLISGAMLYGKRMYKFYLWTYVI